MYLFKKSYIIIFNVFFLFLLLSVPSGFLSAQQDLFNVPAMNITKKGQNFVQEQIIFYPRQMQFDTTYMHGLGNNHEIGLSAYNYFLDTAPKKNSISDFTSSLGPYPAVNSNLQFVYQKKFEPSEYFHVSLGTKDGIASGPTPGSSTFANSNFVMTATEIKSLRTTLFLGSYFGNAAFYGHYNQRIFPGNEPSISKVGMMYGIEVEVVRDKLRVMCDLIAGVNALGVGVCGFSYHYNELYFISVGYQIPNPKDGTFNPHALLIELNAYF
ncbi:hypothetical protein EHO61_09760 [Leptospira fluminis]|uniref:Uncharacterized protein n=1 Tax=Leptospira fluminis TaxID=2484979 RepID=A0A4V3JEJ3_9LEPT|nr:hypothetical protein EHO61_09760 [Leptospira fluminis]